VDNHDEAMSWARKRVFEINPVTGALQIVNVSEAAQAVPTKPEKKKSAGLFSPFEDDVLLSFGLPAVRLLFLGSGRRGRGAWFFLAVNQYFTGEAYLMSFPVTICIFAPRRDYRCIFAYFCSRHSSRNEKRWGEAGLPSH
jgi:hypothetical protein